METMAISAIRSVPIIFLFNWLKSVSAVELYKVF